MRVLERNVKHVKLFKTCIRRLQRCATEKSPPYRHESLRTKTPRQQKPTNLYSFCEGTAFLMGYAKNQKYANKPTKTFISPLKETADESINM